MNAKALLALAPFALAACQADMDDLKPVTKAPVATVTGPAKDCIPIGSSGNSSVHDDYTIDFRVGSQVYRNTLPNRCPGLGFEKAFTYATSLSQLCSTDIIYVLRTTGGVPDRGAGCGLGRFVPVEIVKGETKG